MKKLFATVFATAMAVTAMWAAPAQAEYPEKPVSFVIPFPPGDLEDVLTRMIAEDFQKEYGVPAAVVNKPGGGGGPFPGAVEVAKAPADGSTVGSFVIGVPVVGPLIGIPELNPDPFDPLGIFLLGEAIDAAGFPPGVVNIVNGAGPEVPAALVDTRNVDMISFTGSTGVEPSIDPDADTAFSSEEAPSADPKKAPSENFSKMASHIAEMISEINDD